LWGKERLIAGMDPKDQMSCTTELRGFVRGESHWTYINSPLAGALQSKRRYPKEGSRGHRRSPPAPMAISFSIKKGTIKRGEKAQGKDGSVTRYWIPVGQMKVEKERHDLKGGGAEKGKGQRILLCWRDLSAQRSNHRLTSGKGSNQRVASRRVQRFHKMGGPTVIGK